MSWLLGVSMFYPTNESLTAFKVKKLTHFVPVTVTDYCNQGNQRDWNGNGNAWKWINPTESDVNVDGWNCGKTCVGFPWTGLPQSRYIWVNGFRVNVSSLGWDLGKHNIHGVVCLGCARWNFGIWMRGVCGWTCVWSLSVICGRHGSPLCVGLNIIWMDYSVVEYPPHTPQKRMSTLSRYPIFF